MKMLLNGGAGFIGSNLARILVCKYGHQMLKIDELTYTGYFRSLADLERNTNHHFAKGRVGQTYKIGGNNERKFIDLVRLLCGLLDELHPRADGLSYARQITIVINRPGHDLRYEIDATKIITELGWAPKQGHTSGFRKTVQWYLENAAWIAGILCGEYKIERLGELMS